MFLQVEIFPSRRKGRENAIRENLRSLDQYIRAASRGFNLGVNGKVTDFVGRSFPKLVSMSLSDFSFLFRGWGFGSTRSG